ncbi:hypothetical protein NMG60_11034706 [Bertholletia excelsa]
MKDEKIFPTEVPDDDLVYEEAHDEDSGLNFQECETADLAELKHSRKQALLDFRCKVEDAILSNHILGKNKGKLSFKEKESIRDIALWGVPLLPSKGHEGTDVILLKFLRAKAFRVSEAFGMLRRTLRWRREYDTDSVCGEELGHSMEQVACVRGEDRSGRPVCYVNLGAFHDGAENKQEELLRWRVQAMEKGIQKLQFKPGGIETILQVVDLKHSHGPGMNKRSAMILQENYPEFTARNIFINVPFWHFVSHALPSQIKHQRSQNKNVFARPGRVTHTLLKYIAPENIPIKYGGFMRENDDEFTPDNDIKMLVVRASAATSIEIPIEEEGVTVVWDVTVIGFEVGIKEEFIPDDDCSYNVLIQEEKRMRESIRNSFYIYEPGKIVITIENATAKKKRVFYRYKKKITLPAYLKK